MQQVVFPEGEDEEVRFHEACELEPEHWKGLQRTVQRRVLRDHASRGARRHDLLDESTTDDMLTWRRGAGGFSIDASVCARGDNRHGVLAPNARLRARLLARIYEILPLLCPRHRAKRCPGGRMRIVSFLTEPATVQRILLHLGQPHGPLRIRSALGFPIPSGWP